METFKTYKSYYINNKTWKEQETIKTINKINKMKKGELETLEQWEKSRIAEYLTDKQAKMLYNNDLKALKELLKKYKIKANNKLKEAKEQALIEYNDIKQLKDIKNAVFEIVWTKSRGAYGYQCKCISKVWYKNGDFKYYEGEQTGGCGYDKSSSALSYNLNEVAKILLLKNYNKINNNINKHYDFYACENNYFSYGVGISSYQTMFKNMGYKTSLMYHPNEDITLIIEK